MTRDQIIFFRMNEREEFLEFQQLLQSSGIICSIQFLKGEIDPKCNIDPETSCNEGQEDLANVKTRLVENCSIQFLPGEIELDENVSLAASRADIKKEFSEVKFDVRKEESCSIQFLPGELESNEIVRIVLTLHKFRYFHLNDLILHVIQYHQEYLAINRIL